MPRIAEKKGKVEGKWNAVRMAPMCRSIPLA